MRFFPTLAAALLLLPASLSSLCAQQDTTDTRDTLRNYRLPSVTVNSNRAERGSSPVTFSEISGAELRNAHSYEDLPILLSNLPSTLVYSENGNGVGYSNLSIRGFDQRRIAVLINGVPQNDPEDHNVYWIDFPDLASNLESIQVQRGAGIGGYGPASIGGSINMSTTNFENERSIRISSGVGLQEYGSGDALQHTLSKHSIEYSSGLNDNYAFRARLSRINSDGYRDLSYAELNSFFFSGARYDEDFTTQINVFGGPLSDGLAYTGVPKEYVDDLRLRRVNFSDWWRLDDGTVQGVVRRREERELFSQPHYELLNTWYAAEDLTFNSVLFYYTGDGFFDYDASWATAETFGLTADNGFPDAAPSNAIIRADVSNRHVGWVPRMEWRRGEAVTTIGAELRLNTSEHWGKIAYAENLPAGFDPDYRFYEFDGTRTVYSLFVREQQKLSDKLNFDAEVQVVYHGYARGGEKAFGTFTEYGTVEGGTVGNGDDLFSINYLFVNPRAGILYTLNNSVDLYFSAALTSREPRMNNLYAASNRPFGAQPLFAFDTTAGGARLYDFDEPLVKPERLLNFELGSNFKADGLSAGVNLYWMEFFDELVQNGQVDVFGAPIDGNAERTRHIGVEAEAAGILFNDRGAGALQLSANVSISQNTIVEYHYFDGSGAPIDLADNPIAGFPDLLGNARLLYTLGDFNFSVLGKHVGEFYTDIFKIEENNNDAWTVFNLDTWYDIHDVAGLQTLRLRLQVNNLMNELYSAGGVGAQFFPAAERNYYFAVSMQL